MGRTAMLKEWEEGDTHEGARAAQCGKLGVFWLYCIVTKAIPP
jgi:hypothetical protein